MNLLPMSSMTAGWLLSGSSAQWKGARPGKVFEALIEGEYANPVIVVDEIDKASSDAQYATRWVRCTACWNTTPPRALPTSLPRWPSTRAR